MRGLWSQIVGCLLLASLLTNGGGESPAADSPAKIIAFTTGGAEVIISRRGSDYLRFSLAAWGPGWAWSGWKGTVSSDERAAVGQLTAALAGTGNTVELKFRAANPSPQELVFDYQLRAARDTELTLIAVEILPGKAFQGCKFAVLAGGKQTTVQCPLERRGLGKAVERAEMTDAAGSRSVLLFQPPCDIPSDGAARVVLAQGKLKADQPRQVTITLELPEPVVWYPSIAEIPDQPGADQWYQWREPDTAKGA